MPKIASLKSSKSGTHDRRSCMGWNVGWNTHGPQFVNTKKPIQLYNPSQFLLSLASKLVSLPFFRNKFCKSNQFTNKTMKTSPTQIHWNLNPNHYTLWIWLISRYPYCGHLWARPGKYRVNFRISVLQISTNINSFQQISLWNHH